MDLTITRQEKNAILLYQGCDVPGEYDRFFNQINAFSAINILMMQGQSGERVRICAEKQAPDKISILRWEKTMEIMELLFTAQCKYARQEAASNKPLPAHLERGDRKVNFDLMCISGGTFAFTSTTNGRVRDEFLLDKQEPHVLHITVNGQVPYLDFEGYLHDEYRFRDEQEVLLPPMLQMTCGPCWIQYHPGLGNVPHYNIAFTGFGAELEVVDEKETVLFLNAYAATAADTLTDLVKNKLNAAVWKDDNHIYWKWKSAFRKLALQRLMAIYKTYFGTE